MIKIKLIKCCKIQPIGVLLKKKRGVELWELLNLLVNIAVGQEKLHQIQDLPVLDVEQDILLVQMEEFAKNFDQRNRV